MFGCLVCYAIKTRKCKLSHIGFSVLTSGQWKWSSTSSVTIADILRRVPADLGKGVELTENVVDTVLNTAAGAAHMWVV